MATALITGCDYGIGYELARQYANKGWRVHAICLQNKSRKKLKALRDVAFHRLDVSDQKGVEALAAKLSGTAIDVLINNAATFAPDGPGTLMLPDMEEFTRVMRINAVAPAYVAGAFEDHVAASERRVIVFISTRSGSIGDNDSGGHYAYRCSKAALNMVAKSVSLDFAPRGITAVVMHPGSVATETRTGGTGIPVTESVADLRSVIDTLTLEMSGRFLRYDGSEIEW